MLRTEAYEWFNATDRKDWNDWSIEKAQEEFDTWENPDTEPGTAEELYQMMAEIIDEYDERNEPLKDPRASAAALYDGGWRAHDRDQLIREYNLTAEDADAICISLHEYAGDVANASGTWINYEAAVGYMDDDIREDLHADLAPCSDQEFLTAYEMAHEERTGEKWFLSVANPTW